MTAKPTLNDAIAMLDHLELDEIESLITAAAKAKHSRHTEALAKARAQVADLAAKLGVPAIQLVSNVRGAAAPKATKPAKPAKYRDPDSGQTWNGHGHRPNWLTAKLDAGAVLTQFAI